MDDDTLNLAEEQREREQELARRLLPLRAGDFGPDVREIAMFEALYVEGRSEQDEAGKHGIAPRTMRNIARRTRKRLAAQTLGWRRMTLLELVVERDRLLGICRDAMEGWRLSGLPLLRARKRAGRVETRVETRHGNPRFLQVVTWATSDLFAVELALDRALAEELECREGEASAEPEGDAASSDQSGLGGSPALPRRTVPRGIRRRKSLRGKTLRVALFVRARGACGSTTTVHEQASRLFYGPARCRGDPIWNEAAQKCEWG